LTVADEQAAQVVTSRATAMADLETVDERRTIVEARYMRGSLPIGA
jgi:hypothetical protein